MCLWPNRKECVTPTEEWRKFRTQTTVFKNDDGGGSFLSLMDCLILSQIKYLIDSSVMYICCSFYLLCNCKNVKSSVRINELLCDIKISTLVCVIVSMMSHWLLSKMGFSFWLSFFSPVIYTAISCCDHNFKILVF